MSNQVVLGLDGGGTYTRVAVCDLDGQGLAYVGREGAASFHKDTNASGNTHRTIKEALEQAGRSLSDVAGIVAGVAGLDKESDLEWARELTNIQGISCPARHINDAEAAHFGAFLSAPGIIAISGTGSILFGITETGRQLRNYDFHHYAYTAARHLVFDAVYKIIAGETDESDTALIRLVLAHLGVANLDALAQLASQGFTEDYRERVKLLGSFAPTLTQQAQVGSRLARQICDNAAAALVTGIRLLGACFAIEELPVALIGGVANSQPVKAAIGEALAEKSNRVYKLQEPALPAVLGAAAMALSNHGVALSEQVIGKLKAYSGCLSSERKSM